MMTAKVKVAVVTTTPIGMPVEGSVPGSGCPFRITLFGTKVVPAGGVSVTVTAAPKLPLLLMRMVNTTVSPTVAFDVLAVF